MPASETKVNALTMEQIRKAYKVPAKRGAKIIYHGSGKPEEGIIKSAKGLYLRVKLFGRKKIVSLHPTWKIEYR